MLETADTLLLNVNSGVGSSGSDGGLGVEIDEMVGVSATSCSVLEGVLNALSVVRVEFLSINGKVTSGLSKPCMLRFKSPPIRFMETFIKSGSLIAGYSSESQAVDLALSGFTEGPEPTVSIRIVLEQRAEYRPGAGIPEIYAASLKLESKLPILKRMIWSWRRTLHIWSAMGFFIWEVLIILVCCRPVLFPCRRRINNASTSTSSS